MGNTASAEEDEEALLDPFDGADTLGYRVLGVQPDSPASKAGLCSFLDFLIGANGEMLLASGENVEHGEEYPDVDLPALLEDNKGKAVQFLVWNMKSQKERLVYLTPDDGWGGAGLLGVTIRLDNYAGAEERLVRVLEVESPQAPAAMAGLVPFHDYILGTTSETLQDTSQLGAILEENVDRVVELYVYNSQSDLVRTVALMPTLSWGGPGLLGAAVGTGYLHRFPSKAQETTGASVVRKVRYLGTSAPKSPTDHGSSKGSEGPPRLELEPQLEMEAAPSEESDSGEFNTPQPKERKHVATQPPLPTPDATTAESAASSPQPVAVQGKQAGAEQAVIAESLPLPQPQPQQGEQEEQRAQQQTEVMVAEPPQDNGSSSKTQSEPRAATTVDPETVQKPPAEAESDETQQEQPPTATPTSRSEASIMAAAALFAGPAPGTTVQ